LVNGSSGRAETGSNNSTGIFKVLDNSSTGTGYVLNSVTGSTGDLIQFRKNSVNTTVIDQNGIITTPTPTAGDNTTRVATTAFVQNAFASGSFTPTITNASNTSALSVTDATYTKIGNIVTARISLTATATLVGASSCSFTLTLPVNRASTTSINMGDGSFQDNTSGSITAVKVNSATTTNVTCVFTSTGLNAYSGAVVIQYSIL